MRERDFSLVIIFILTVAACAALWLFVTHRTEVFRSTPVMCSTEAKICPDGSVVVRGGTDCAFATCPSEIVSTTTSADDTSANTNTAHIGETVLQHGVQITTHTLEEDSRCPIDVTCIQVGTVRLGVSIEVGDTSTTTTLTQHEPYVFEGKRITLTNVTPVPLSSVTRETGAYAFTFVVNNIEASTTGTLTGTMHIGPICPVESIETPCTPTKEVYASRALGIYTRQGGDRVTTVTPSADGTFTASLAPGSYYIDLLTPHTGPGGVSGLPTTTTIRAHEETSLTISIDTGIR